MGERSGKFGDKIPGEKLGKYTGTTLFRTHNPGGQDARAQISRLARQGEDKLLLPWFKSLQVVLK